MNAWNRFLSVVVRHRLIALSLVAVAIGSGAVVAKGVGFSASVTEHLPMEEEAVRFWLESSERFGAFDSLIVGLEEPGKPLTAEGLRSLQRITKGLEGLKSKGVVWTRSLANLDAIREGEDGAINNELFLTSVPEAPEGLVELARRIKADSQVSGAFVSRDQRGYAVMLRLDPKADAAAAARAIEEVVEEERGALAAYYFGAPFFTASVGKQVEGRLPWLVPAMIILLIGVLVAGFRRAVVSALVLVAALAGVVVWLALLRFSGSGLTKGTVTVELVVFALGLLAFARGLESVGGDE